MNKYTPRWPDPVVESTVIVIDTNIYAESSGDEVCDCDFCTSIRRLISTMLIGGEPVH